ncbi:MAG: hypothetical protein IPG24_11905 [Leptospiraceae bacterium]|nr:hypothetical protein [Leptospiraceae bacterium]
MQTQIGKCNIEWNDSYRNDRPLKTILRMESETISGIKSEYGGFASNEFWSQVTRDSDNCLSRRCLILTNPFIFRKEKWNKANILIVNHYLLAAHIAGDFKLLPDFSNLIIDEAHSFPDVLGKSFGLKASYEDISKLISFVGGARRRQGLIPKIQDTALREKCLEIVGNINKSIIVFLTSSTLKFLCRLTPKNSKEIHFR